MLTPWTTKNGPSHSPSSCLESTPAWKRTSDIHRPSWYLALPCAYLGHSWTAPLEVTLWVNVISPLNYARSWASYNQCNHATQSLSRPSSAKTCSNVLMCSSVLTRSRKLFKPGTKDLSKWRNGPARRSLCYAMANLKAFQLIVWNQLISWILLVQTQWPQFWKEVYPLPQRKIFLFRSPFQGLTRGGVMWQTSREV